MKIEKAQIDLFGAKRDTASRKRRGKVKQTAPGQLDLFGAAVLGRKQAEKPKPPKKASTKKTGPKPTPKPTPKPKKQSGGYYVGPRGGKWADPQHKIPWKEPKPEKTKEQLEEIKHNRAAFKHLKGLFKAFAEEIKGLFHESWRRDALSEAKEVVDSIKHLTQGIGLDDPDTQGLLDRLTQEFRDEMDRLRAKDKEVRAGKEKEEKEGGPLVDAQGRIKVRVNSAGLTAEQIEGRRGRKRNWWLMRFADRRGDSPDFLDIDATEASNEYDEEMWLKPGTYLLGAGEKGDGIRHRFVVELPAPPPPKPKPAKEEPPLTDAERESARLFEWGPDTPPNFFHLNRAAIGFEKVKDGKFFKGEMSMNLALLRETGFYDMFKGKRGDYWSLGFFLNYQGTNLDEMPDMRTDRGSGRQVENKGKKILETLNADMGVWWSGLTDDQREIFARRYCDPVKQKNVNKAGLDAAQHDSDFEVPPGMEKFNELGYKFHEYQRKAVNFVTKHATGNRAVLALEMGLGKTMIAVASYHELKRMGRVDQMIVTSPASAFESWKSHFDEFSDARVTVLEKATVKQRERAYAAFKRGEIDVIVLSSQSIANDKEKIKGMFNPDRTLRVADEVHLYKNPKSNRTKSFREALGGSRPGPTIGMTGTILPNRPEDFFEGISCVSPGTLGKHKWDFARKYCTVVHGDYAKEITGFSTDGLEAMYQHNSRTMFARRSNDPDVRLDLPNRIDLSPILDKDPIRDKIATHVASLFELRQRSRGKIPEVWEMFAGEMDGSPFYLEFYVPPFSMGRNPPSEAAYEHAARSAYIKSEAKLAKIRIEAIRGERKATGLAPGPRDGLHKALAHKIPVNALGIITLLRQADCDPRTISPEVSDACRATVKEFTKAGKRTGKSYEPHKLKHVADETHIHLSNNPEKGAVVFSSYVGALDGFAESMVARGVPRDQIRIYTKSKVRNSDMASQDISQITKDLNSGKIKLVIAQNKALQTGANLQKRANFVGHLDTPYSPDILTQCTGRVYRQGQKEVTTVYRPTSSALEEAIERRTLWKLRNSAESIGKMTEADRFYAESIVKKHGEMQDFDGSQLTEAEIVAKVLGIDPEVFKPTRKE